MNESINKLKAIFQHGDIELKGQFMLGSNYTFLVKISHAGKEYPAVYKPSKGEQPLWDFPESALAQREVAAYIMSEALGFGFVPFTILRDGGPFGPGSLQQYIEYNPEYHYFNFIKEDKALLQPVALFDLLINNADRKGSHIFFENGTHKLWLIDHGLCFHEEDKLRTVIWDFAGQPIADDLLSHLSSTESWRGILDPYLSPREIAAMLARADTLLSSRVFPRAPEDRRAFPYPPI